MGSTEPGHSINSSMSLPQWMKTKIGDRYDLDETFSPPSHDDSFFYIRYPKADATSQKLKEPNFLQTNELLHTSEQTPKQDFSQHTIQCRQFIPEEKVDLLAPTGAMESMSSASRNMTRMQKPAGTDDDPTGDTAGCGKSVVQVAHQMIAGGMLMRGFSASDNGKSATGEGFNRAVRRGSKSLPASPLGSPSHSPESSPQTHRRVYNRYFTGTFTFERANIHATGGQELGSKYSGSWLLSGLLGQQQQRDNLSDSQDSITIPEEEQEKEVSKRSGPRGEVNPLSPNMRRNKSMTALVSQVLSEGPKDTQDVEVGVDATAVACGCDSPMQKNKTFRAKPSELREMNFWSPTSM